MVNMEGETEINSIISKVEEHIGLLQNLKLGNIDDVEDIDSALNNLIVDINSKNLAAKNEEVERLNEVFGRLNRIGRTKAKRYNLIYNKPKVVTTKNGSKRTKIKIMTMEGATITKEPPSSANKPKEVTSETRILLRVNEPAPITENRTSTTPATSANLTTSRKETAYGSLEEANSWLNEMTGMNLPMPKLKFMNSVEWVRSAIEEPRVRNLCLASGYADSPNYTVWVDTLGETKAAIPAIVAHEFQHLANDKVAHSLESRIRFWRGNRSWDNVPDKELPAPALMSKSQFITTYMREAPSMLFAAAFECRGSENPTQSKYVMPGLILDKMRSETSWPLKFSRERVISYAKRVYNEIGTNISRRQIDVGLEDQMTTSLAATKVRSNDETRHELIALDKTLDRLADTTSSTAIYGVRAPAIAMLIYAKNDFDLKATITDLVSKKPLELISMIKDTPRSAIDNLDKLL